MFIINMIFFNVWILKYIYIYNVLHGAFRNASEN